MHELTNAQSHSELPKDFHLKQPGRGRSVLKAGNGNSYDAYIESPPFETAANAKEATNRMARTVRRTGWEHRSLDQVPA
jgi:hypothetical protein